MVTEVERLAVLFEANTKQFANAVAKIERQTQGYFGRSIKLSKRFDQSMLRNTASVRALAGAFGFGFGAAQFAQFLEASTRITNALKVVGLEGEKLDAVYNRLLDSANRNVAPIESLVSLYSRAALAQKELGVSTEELLVFTDNVAVALRVSGVSAESARGALLQLSQAIGSGIVRGEEFNSILEGALPIAQAAAAGLEEAGGSVAKLRKLVIDGKVSSQAFFRAFEAGAVTLQTKVADAELTVSQSFVRLQNVLIDAAKKFNETTGASKSTGVVLGEVADVIEIVADNLDKLEGPLRTADKWFKNLHDSVAEAGKEFGKFTGLDKVGTAMRQFFGLAPISDTAPGSANAAGKSDKLGPPKPRAKPGGGRRTVSLSDFTVPGDTKQDKQAQRDADRRQKVIDDLKFEAEQLGRTSQARELYNQLNRAGVELNSVQGQKIAELVGQLQSQEQATLAAADAQQLLGNTALEVFDAMALNGEKAGDVIADLAKKLALAAAQAALMGQGPLANIFGTADSGGALGQLFGGFRASGGPVSAGKAFMVGEQGPELFVPGRSGQIVSNAAMRGGSSGGGTTVVQNIAANLSRVDRAWVEAKVQQGVRDAVTATDQNRRRLNSGRSDNLGRR